MPLTTHLPDCVPTPWGSCFHGAGTNASVPQGPAQWPCGQHSSERLQRPPWLTFALFSLSLQRNLVWAVMIAIPLVTILYVLVNISYLLVMSPLEILSSDAMAVSWG